MPASVIYIQPGGVPWRRQVKLCIDYCHERGYLLQSVVPAHAPAQAVELVASGRAHRIVAAFSPRARPGDLRDLAYAAGVHVDYVRPPVVRREVGQLVVHLYRQAGGDVRRVAEQAGWTSQEIRTTLARMGVLRESPRPRDAGGASGRDDGR